MSGRPDPVAVAWAALGRSASAVDCAVSLIEGDAAPWWSATFAGDVVWLTLRIGADAEGWLATLPDADLALTDQFVADCAVERHGETVIVSLLILDADAIADPI